MDRSYQRKWFSTAQNVKGANLECLYVEIQHQQQRRENLQIFAIFPREVFQTKKALAFHAKYCANLSVEDYYRKFVKGEDIPESPSTIAPSPHVNKVKAAGGFQNWINQCSIQCQVCAMNFTNDGVAANHISYYMVSLLNPIIIRLKC